MPLKTILSVFALFIFTSSGFTSFAQEFTPLVAQYSKREYKGSNQNWSISQSSDGVLYFGNNEGLIRFNGSDWRLFKIPNNKTVRSVFVSKDDKIYIGSFEEFGYFEKDLLGEMHYTSLSERVKDYKMKNDEIWDISERDGAICFQSFTSLFIYKDSTVVNRRHHFIYMFPNSFNQKVYTNTAQYGFCEFDYNKGTFLHINNSPIKKGTVALLPLASSSDSPRSLLVTKSEGIFIFDGKGFKRFQTKIDDELSQYNINKAILTKDSLLVIGTIDNGVIAIERDGDQVWTLNTSNVLQNNTVLGMFCDSENNLWLALDKGISMVKLGNSLRYIHSFSPSVGSIYSLEFQEPNNLFIASNQGFYRAKLNIHEAKIEGMTIDPKIKGQVWNISHWDNQFFCNNNEETYEVNAQSSKVLSPVKGGTCMSRGRINGKDVLVQGTYSELCIYQKRGNSWVYSHSVENFINPIKFIEIDYKGTIWAAHLHKGMYEIHLSDDLLRIESIRVYNSLSGEEALPINLFSLNNRVVFTDKNGFYTFDDLKKEIIPFHSLNTSLGQFASSYRICPFKTNYYWFISPDEAALVRFSSDTTEVLDRILYSSFTNQTVDNHQFIFPINSTTALLTLENGLALYEIKEANTFKGNYPLQIDRVSVYNRSSSEATLIPNQNISGDNKVKYSFNNIRFSVFYPIYSSLDDFKYQYRLKGMDTTWSKGSTYNIKEYNYLPSGDYSFEVRAVTRNGQELSRVNYSFTIKSPFYWDWYSKIIYLFLLSSLIYLTFWIVRRRYTIKNEKCNREQEELRIKEIEKREQQIIALKNEKLEAELELKTKELTLSTMTLINKNQLLISIKSEVIEQKQLLGKQYPNKYYDRMIRLLDSNITSEEDWATFQLNFDKIHGNFFSNLRHNYPDLTSNDLKLCAYLHLNLSSKDIANLMNISLKGVEVARYRIRKKIGLSSDKSLTEFMMEFK